jgi:hypothetical protein
MTTTLNTSRSEWFCRQGEGFCMHVFSSLLVMSMSRHENIRSQAPGAKSRSSRKRRVYFLEYNSYLSVQIKYRK